MKCVVQGCTNNVHVKSRGWCTTHYPRWWKHGDITVVKPPGFPASPRSTARWSRDSTFITSAGTERAATPTTFRAVTPTEHVHIHHQEVAA